jgi:hypothetical protein
VQFKIVLTSKTFSKNKIAIFFQGKQEQAKGLMDAALAMQKGGYTPEAQAQAQAFASKLKGQAEGLLNSASADKGVAETYQGVAEGISKSIPAYQAYAGQAALRAAVLANPAQQVPPPMPMM